MTSSEIPSAGPAHELDHAGQAALIEPAHHLVEQQQARPRGERAGQLEPLALACAEAIRNRVQAVREADEGEAALRFGAWPRPSWRERGSAATMTFSVTVMLMNGRTI